SGESQDFFTNVGWRGGGPSATAGLCLLLPNAFTHFVPAFSIGDYRGVPSRAKHCASSFAIHAPKEVGDPCLCARPQRSVGKLACIGGQRNQERLSIGASLSNDSFGFGIFGWFAFARRVLRRSAALRLTLLDTRA